MAHDSPITFIKQSIRDFRNTGSVTPSSQFLARAMARSLPEQINDDYRVLEVGPGTGSITSEIVKRMDGRGRLDLFEISPAFCAVLRTRLAEESGFRHMQSRVVVHQGDVRSLPPHPRYNAIISGLPFSNFSPEEVQGFLEHFRALLRPKGALIWFEYVALRRLQSVFVSKTRREQLKAVSAVTRRFVRSHQHRQEIIAINFPPARVLHLKFG